MEVQSLPLWEEPILALWELQLLPILAQGWTLAQPRTSEMWGKLSAMLWGSGLSGLRPVLQLHITPCGLVEKHQCAKGPGTFLRLLGTCQNGVDFKVNF